jgi:fused signal recognition particle receptor
MFGFMKKKKGDEGKSPDAIEVVEQAPAESAGAEDIAESVQQAEAIEVPSEAAENVMQTAVPVESTDEAAAEKGFFGRLKERLSRTSSSISEGVAGLVMGKKSIDVDVLDELETQLLTADVGVEATMAIIDDLTARMKRKQLDDVDALFAALRENMVEILTPVSQPLSVDIPNKPYVILMVGINGAGKTTTIGKLAKRFQNEGRSVMLAAGDTFRAAAVEQLQTWGERNNVPVVAQQRAADPASVAFDAVQAAMARKADVLIVDTAGRLHTQSNLMEELKKIKRVMSKLDEWAPHEVLLVLDGGIGQNAVAQAEQFHQAVGVTGLALTKLDGTAKGGVVLAIARKLGLPIRLIGVGEGIDDLRDFEAEEFVDALLVKPEV